MRPYLYFCSPEVKQILVSVTQSYVKCTYTYSLTMLYDLNECFEVIVFVLEKVRTYLALVFLQEKDDDNIE